MEYIPGQDLSHLLKSCRRSGQVLPHPLLARILIGACEGLHYAHTLKDPRGNPLKLVHRDMTPSNILVAYEGATKVLDFGVAKAESQMSKTAAGKLKGKFPYMAPEQIRQDKIDARVDVWSLGVVLWEALTSRRLFSGDNELAVIRSILEGMVSLPSRIIPGVPPQLDAIVLKALQRDRNKRYLSAQEMQNDLEAYLRTLSSPVTTLDVSTFLKRVFEVEYAAHEQLLAQIPHATADQLADLVQRAEPGSSAFGEGSHSGTSEARTNPRLRVQRKRTPLLAGLGALVLVAAAAVGYLATRPAPVTAGEIAVTSEPSGAAIFLDGAPRAEKTPAALKPVPLGKHEIRLELSGRQPRTAPVELTATRAVVAVSQVLPEAVVEPGTLVVATVPPGANVYLDGARQVPSPVTIPKVAAGVEHTVIADKDGFEVASQTLTLAAGEKKEIQIPLKPKVAEAAPGPRRPGKGPKGGSSGATGTLSLTVTPACDVFVDGRKIGTSPLSAPLPAGELSVQLVNKELSISQWVQVSVAPGGKTEKTITLGKGKIAADVQPWADVYIGDKKLGTTPMAPREVYEGSYLVRLVNSELGAIKTVNVTVRPGQTAVIRQNLQP